MADKGYLLSEKLLREVQEANRKIKLLQNKTTDRLIGQNKGERYIVKITGKSTESGYPLSCVYEGSQVVTDSNGEFQVVSGGLVWGDGASGSLPPIIDLRSLESINGNLTDDDLQRLQPNSYVEVFQRGTDSGELEWYTNGLDPWFDKSFGVDFVVESGTEKIRIADGRVFNDLVSTAVVGANFTVATAGFVFVRYTINLKTNAITVITPVEFVAGARPDEFNDSAGVRTCKIPIAEIVSGGKINVLHQGEIDANQDAIRNFVLFPVDVTQTGGVAGDATTKCSFTYTVDTLDGDQLLTVASPVWNRQALGKFVAATSGTAYFNNSNVPILYQVDEVADAEVCP